MNNNLVPRPRNEIVSAGGTRKLDRSTLRALASVRSGALIQAERVAAVGYVAERAMSEITYLAQKHVVLIGIVPLADQGLQMIRDTATLAMAQIVADTGRSW